MDLQEQYNKLLRYCYMKTKDRYLAEDITQESFLKFWQSKSYKDTGKEMAYLYTIARNLCTDAFRRPVWDDIECHKEIEDSSSGILCSLIEDRIVLENALEQLPDAWREMIVLKYVSGLSDKDIGQMFGISRFAVHRRVRNSLNILKEGMDKEKKDDK